MFSKLFHSTPIAQVNSFEAKARLETDHRPFLLDVRQPEEFVAGHIQGARLIPLGELPRRLKELPRDREILCICHSGSRSSHAARQLHSAGYRVINLKGGMDGWQRAGLPVRTGK